jgi:hypothetical protein
MAESLFITPPGFIRMRLVHRSLLHKIISGLYWQGQIRSVVGQGRLIMDERFKQFSGPRYFQIYKAVLRIRIRDFFTSGSGSGIPDHFSGSLGPFLGKKCFFFLFADTGSGAFLTLGSGLEKFGLGINIPDRQHGYKS